MNNARAPALACLDTKYSDLSIFIESKFALMNLTRRCGSRQRNIYKMVSSISASCRSEHVRKSYYSIQSQQSQTDVSGQCVDVMSFSLGEVPTQLVPQSVEPLIDKFIYYNIYFWNAHPSL